LKRGQRGNKRKDGTTIKLTTTATATATAQVTVQQRTNGAYVVHTVQNVKAEHGATGAVGNAQCNRYNEAKSVKHRKKILQNEKNRKKGKNYLFVVCGGTLKVVLFFLFLFFFLFFFLFVFFLAVALPCNSCITLNNEVTNNSFTSPATSWSPHEAHW